MMKTWRLRCWSHLGLTDHMTTMTLTSEVDVSDAASLLTLSWDGAGDIRLTPPVVTRPGDR